MISDLQIDSRIRSIDINKSSSIEALINNISSTGMDSQQLDGLINRNHLMIS